MGIKRFIKGGDIDNMEHHRDCIRVIRNLASFDISEALVHADKNKIPYSEVAIYDQRSINSGIITLDDIINSKKLIKKVV